MNPQFEIVPLSTENIDEAITLVHSIFPYDATLDRTPGMAFRVSLNPENYPDFFSADSADFLQYFVAIHKNNKEVLGTTGFYHLKREAEDTIWLGWYCVKPEYRGKGLGKALLQFIIDLASKQNRKTLMLYADTESKEAIEMYKKFGFQIDSIEPQDGWEKIIMKLKL